MSRYRSDIDGLRAVAVLAVLLLHAFPAFMPGGYVGVDVFFVISGFLITGILVSEVAEGTFSVRRFYVRRAQRLFPALIVVMLTVLVFGWIVLLPSEFVMLGKHELAGAGFVSNIAFWREEGYFDVSAKMKPLLHLWSLGVEEQYYLLWPLIVFFLVRRRARFWMAAALLGIGSFAINVALVGSSPSFAFYMLLTRFWELLVGGALALVAWDRSADAETAPTAAARVPASVHAQSVGGLVMILISIVTFDHAVVFPGWPAALPVLGSALVIGAGPRGVVNRLLSWRPMVWIGLVSYPLYLWHWPVLAYARILEGGSISVVTASVLAAASVGLAGLTYHFVELPLRARRRSRFALRQAVALWAVTAVVGALGFAAWVGWIQPRSAASVLVQKITNAQADWSFGGDRDLAGDRPQRVLFVGDSHMQQYWVRVEKVVRERRAPVYSVSFRTEAGCAPMTGIERRAMRCSQFAEEALDLAREAGVRTVVLAASWYGLSIRDDYYRVDDGDRQPVSIFTEKGRWVLDRWSSELRTLVLSGKRVVLVLSNPRGPAVDPVRLVDRGVLRWVERPAPARSRRDLRSVVAEVDGRIREIAGEVGAETVDPFEWLCYGETCPVVTPEGDPIFKDESHLRASFVRERLPMLDEFVYEDGRSMSRR